KKEYVLSRRSIYRSKFRILMLHRNNGKLIKKLNNYEDNIINFIELFIKEDKINNTKLIERIINIIIVSLYFGNCFKLINYFNDNFNVNIEISKNDMEYCVANI